MLIQVFRNETCNSQKFNSFIRKIDSVIRANFGQKEPIILSEIIKIWNLENRIPLSPFVLNANRYNLEIQFQVLKTHGRPYPRVSVDLTKSQDKPIKYDTELGDLAIFVEYIIDKELISARASILQTKIEANINSAKIPLHQLFLMRYWPEVNLKGTPFTFRNVYPDEFAFYHFILEKSNLPACSSSISSAQLVAMQLGLSKHSIISNLTNCIMQGKKPHKMSPLTLTGLQPRSISSLRYYGWSQVPKPFSRFLRDVAYLFLGTNNLNVFHVISRRVPNILRIRVAGFGAEGYDEMLRQTE